MEPFLQNAVVVDENVTDSELVQNSPNSFFFNFNYIQKNNCSQCDEISDFTGSWFQTSRILVLEPTSLAEQKYGMDPA